MSTRLIGLIALCSLTAGGCTDKPEPAPADDSTATAVAPDPTAPSTTDATADNDDLADLVKLFVAAIDRQDAILKRYAKDDATLKAGDGEPLWQAEVDAERALSRIAALAKEHPDWKSTIVKWWHAEIEPANVRQFRAGRHTLKSALLKQAAPDLAQLRSLLLRELGASVTLDRLAKEVKAGV